MSFYSNGHGRPVPQRVQTPRVSPANRWRGAIHFNFISRPAYRLSLCGRRLEHVIEGVPARSGLCQIPGRNDHSPVRPDLDTHVFISGSPCATESPCYIPLLKLKLTAAGVTLHLDTHRTASDGSCPSLQGQGRTMPVRQAPGPRLQDQMCIRHNCRCGHQHC